MKDSKINIYGVFAKILESEDRGFIKRCIERRKDLGLQDNHLYLLISRVKDADFIKQCIENWRELVTNPQDRYELIRETEDIDYIKECINRKKDLELDSEYIAGLIVATEDDEYKKYYVENKRKMFTPFQIYRLVQSIEDVNYKKQCVENWKDYNLSLYKVYELIKDIDDGKNKYINYCIENMERLDIVSKKFYHLIIETNDTDFMKECIEKKDKYMLESHEIYIILNKIKDDDYSKQCIERREKLNLKPNDISLIIRGISDEKYKEKCVELHTELEIENDNLVLLISSCNDTFIEECIQKKEKFGFDLSNEISLMLSVSDKQYAKNKMESIFNDFDEKYNKNLNKVKIPDNMTVGIEIEAEGENASILKHISLNIADGWDFKNDSSLTYGVEAASPILKGSDKTISNSINRLCGLMKALDLDVSERCGGHIHIGADYLTDIKALAYLTEIWGNAEKLLFLISNKEGEIPRENIEDYAMPISKNLEAAIAHKTTQLKDEKDLKRFVKNVQKNKWYAINFQHLDETNKNTIEFRLANGSLEPNTWIDNINLFGGIVKAAQDLALIDNKYEISIEEKQKINSLETLKDTKKNDREKLEALLKLAIEEDDRNIYIKRYEENKKLINLESVGKIINYYTAKGTISLKDIGKKIFTGEHAITRSEYIQGESIINEYLSQEINR